MADIGAALRARRGFALATVNLDHLVKIGEDPAFAASYAAQDIVVADGRPIVWLARLAGETIELLPGSDMIVPLCSFAQEAGVPIAIIGSTELALQDARAHLCAALPGLEVAYAHAPPMGFDPEGDTAAEVLRAVEASGAGLCFLALGAPKQEALAARGRSLAPSVGFASIGAGLDFLGGHQRRAPAWVRAIALEWLWRALSSPARLVPRYAKCFAILPALIWRTWRAK
ncbi:WecB/TagA/CpsF family glycosyltransferase [Roseovarius carneus]|uniref:WecB/TagA/CpsF family glycosyltransferase n=1 Tax=Roseovarius carneus TaxID=2853164 RepID=UPI001CCE3806|nr:WecB/TagA/CpsF family glycosyltransferase [Roseovarius carneus]